MALAATRKLVRDPQLRRLMAVCATFLTSNSAHGVLLTVFAFSVGGAATVGVVTLVRMLPSALLAPLAATLATSPRPQVHLAIGVGARGMTTIATVIVVVSGAPLGVVLVVLGVDSLMSAAVRSLHAALVVRLATSVAEAATANAATGVLLYASALAGPALAGVMLAFVGVGWALTLPAALFVVGALTALRITVAPIDDMPDTGSARPSGGVARVQLRAVGAGFRAIIESRPAAAAATLFLLTTTLLDGFWYVASAPLAADQFGLGPSGVTTIMTIYGVGGLLGAVAMLSIAGRGGLARMFTLARLSEALLLAAIGAASLPALGLVLAAGVGGGSAASWAIAPTLVQRSVNRASMVTAAASLQSVSQLAIAAGAGIAAVLVGSLGLTGALAIVSGAAALITVLAWPQVRRADKLSDDDSAKLAVIRATPVLAPLPALALEQLARTATRMAVPAGSDVIRQSDRGDRFYMIASGLADATVNGRRVATLGPGGSFGEIALLHDVARSATVTARKDLDLVAVDRAEFLAALSSNTAAGLRLGGLARTRLGTVPVEERLIELGPDPALNSQSLSELLAAQPALAGIGDGALRELADTAKVLAAPDGALITCEGDHGDTYYVILEGAAQVLDDDTAVHHLGPGEGFGEQAILRDVPRTATVRAVGDTTLVAVDREAFQRARR
ncbi:Cyclic nucleotide-gated potassium channel [Mycobacterium marinum]|uniref:cyclic nucleotide-binding domain-containing protein n=1 Tax=Mycobacterium marinum TaxID=1781 RepID=UPI000E3CF500|nr:cyclic nucleotide-binding domain-containing protein [Mycobacterium marinum]RFZ09160.1 Cyclic nucleotide-gated potassium channel [Mycobacterium marinum]